MIIEALIGSISIVITQILKLFPIVNSTTLTSINTTYASFRSTIASASWIFPTDTAFTLLGIVLGIELTVLTVRMIRWVIRIVSGGFISA